MTQTHTSYEFSRKLKAFLGESAPEPMVPAWWVTFGSSEPRIIPNETAGKIFPAAYQLHDLLSKPFCEAFIKERFARSLNHSAAAWEVIGYIEQVVNAYYNDGLPAVEKALTEMMETK